jgi:hypothetical protein
MRYRVPAMSETPPERSGSGQLAHGGRAAGRGTITRISIGVQWRTDHGTTERYYAMPLLRQYIRWEDMTEFLDGLEAICREVQERSDEHRPPERRLRLR